MTVRIAEFDDMKQSKLRNTMDLDRLLFQPHL